MLELAQCTRMKYIACVREMIESVGGKPTQQPTDRHSRDITYMSTPPNPTIRSLHQNMTQLVHRALQLMADPAPNPLLGHQITQSHVQFSQFVQAAQTGRNGAAELMDAEGPDATARGVSVVSMSCTAMIHSCLGCGVCWSLIAVVWGDRPRAEPDLCDL